MRLLPYVVGITVLAMACSNEPKPEPMIVDSSFADEIDGEETTVADSESDGDETSVADSENTEATVVADSNSDDSETSQQGACDSCSSTGVQRAMTAETDPAQIVSGFRSGTAEFFSQGLGTGFMTLLTRYAELTTGPVVVTHLTGSVGDDSGPRLFYTTTAESCDVRASEQETRIILGEQMSQLHARISVPAGTRLCMRRGPGTSASWTAWAGFRPYE